MNNTVHYFNGQWVTADKLLIPVKDLSVVRGFGVFDFLRTYQGRAFHLPEHIDRFFRSAKFLELEIPLSKQALVAIVEEGIDRNKLPETGVRLTLTGGVADDAYMITPGTPSLIVTFGPISSPPTELYQKGGKVITTPHIRQLPEAKSLNYMLAVLAHREVKRQGAVEALYVDNDSGEIFEGTIANVMVVKDGTIITPKDNVLIGITRNVVLELAGQLGIPTKEAPLSLHELSSYQEMFITGTTKEVMPITHLDDQQIGDGNVGPITAQLITAFNTLTGKK